VDAYLLDLEVDELPGVGWNVCQKLKELGIASVRDVRASTKDVLQREIGNKTGARRLFCILSPMDSCVSGSICYVLRS